MNWMFEGWFMIGIGDVNDELDVLGMVNDWGWWIGGDDELDFEGWLMIGNGDVDDELDG